MKLDEILNQVDEFNVRHITVTGGEPLAQKDCVTLLTALCDKDFIVSLETSGSMDISDVDRRVIKVMDIKTPASGESNKNDFGNLSHLLPHDQVKFVICDRQDYEWACDILEKYNIAEICEVLFSPTTGQLSASHLADWIVEDRLAVRFQLQLHKILWGDQPGR